MYATLGMRLQSMDALDHDRHVAYVSHISHITSFVLATTVLEIEKNTSTIFDLAGSGFESTVRLAKSSPDMWAPIFGHNAEFVCEALDAYIRNITAFRNMIAEGQGAALLDTMSAANEIRRVLAGITSTTRPIATITTTTQDIRPRHDGSPSCLSIRSVFSGSKPGGRSSFAGPCSAESEEQVMPRQRNLQRLKRVHAFRAGVWKPRTRPSTFEGIGSAALAWLRAASEATGLPTAVEVANSRHVDQALAGGDRHPLGRCTHDSESLCRPGDRRRPCGCGHPRSRQESHQSRTSNSGSARWNGSTKRVSRQLGAIHRGFSTFEQTQYRNKPNWEIPIELKRRVPGLPLICDPSHICGRTEILQRVSQTAMDLNFDGLMIESHINPREALSDARQQLTPAETGTLLEHLVFRKETIDNVLTRTTLEELRERIDKIDHEMLGILAERMTVAERIGTYKKQNNITILQSSRWDEIVRTRLEEGKQKHLTDEFVLRLFEIIHQESIFHQSKIMNEEVEEREPEPGAGG